MFKEVVSHQGFWKSVLSLELAFIVLFLIIKWAIEGFSFEFIERQDPLIFWGGMVGAGFIYGFLTTFVKFRKKLKDNAGR